MFIFKPLPIFLKLKRIVANIQEMPNPKFQLNRLQIEASTTRNRLRLCQFLGIQSCLHIQISLLHSTAECPRWLVRGWWRGSVALTFHMQIRTGSLKLAGWWCLMASPNHQRDGGVRLCLLSKGVLGLQLSYNAVIPRPVY